MLELAEHSYFWLGVERVQSPSGGTVGTAEQMYVEYFVPADVRSDYPLVMVHGGGGQGMAFFGPGDGKPGWLHHALRRGHAVYIPDRPGFGRNPPHPDLVGRMDAQAPYEDLSALFKIGAASGRWAGSGEVGDPGLDQFMAQQRPMRFDTAAYAQRLTQKRGIELLERIGPAVVVTHSAGGPFGWLVADARPDLVKALVSVEGLGPPTLAIPLTFDPPISTVDDLALSPLPDDAEIDWGPLGGLPRVVQADPARALPRLAQVPIAVVTSDDPRFAALNRSTVSFLRQAGCTVDELRLSDLGISGNSHLMTIEENNEEVLDTILEWIAGVGR